MSLINQENYYEEVLLYKRSKPKGCEFFVVKDIDSPAAKAWLNYADRKGWGARKRFWASRLISTGSLTMPCERPSDFDPSVYQERRWRDGGM